MRLNFFSGLQEHWGTILACRKSSVDGYVLVGHSIPKWTPHPHPSPSTFKIHSAASDVRSYLFPFEIFTAELATTYHVLSYHMVKESSVPEVCIYMLSGLPATMLEFWNGFHEAVVKKAGRMHRTPGSARTRWPLQQDNCLDRQDPSLHSPNPTVWSVCHDLFFVFCFFL